MRKILAVALASTFLTAAPVAVVSSPVEAANLFEKLFPRATKRRSERRQRQIRRRRELEINRARLVARQRAPKVVQKVKSPTFKNYTPTVLRTVALASLANSFSAHDQKLLAADALARTRPKQEPQPRSEPVALESQTELPVLEDTQNLTTESVEATVTLASQTTEIVEPVVEVALPEKPIPTLAAIRLSAGAELLSSIKISARRNLGKAVVAHYKKSPEFIWLDGEGKLNDNARSVLQILADADAYGLNADDYTLPILSFADDASNQDILRAAMQLEFSITTAMLRYMADAKNGVVNPNGISGYHDFSGLSSDYKANLAKISDSDDAAADLLAAHPKEPAFEHLRSQLAGLREEAAGYESVTIKTGTFIRPGQTNDQLENIVESIRRLDNRELMIDHFDVFAMSHEEGVYSEDVEAMVRDFQKAMKLKPDGIIGRKSIARMSGDDPKVKMNKVLYAIERLRWHPDRFGNTHVFINQPAYRATYMTGGKPQLSMRAVVGKPSN